MFPRQVHQINGNQWEKRIRNMSIKFVLAVAVMAVAAEAALLGPGIPRPHHYAAGGYGGGYAAGLAAPYADYDPNPQYTYSYSVADAYTGDTKDQTESRNGDVVHGSYSVVEPDGNRRTVEYTADPVAGFNAVVHNTHKVAVSSAGAIAAGPAAVHAAPLAYRPAPVAAAYAAPVAPAYAAPIVAKPYVAAPIRPYAAAPIRPYAAAAIRPYAAAPYAAAPYAARPYVAPAYAGAHHGNAFATTHFSSPHAAYSH
ncbi:cuticle protein 21-like [Ischnura elegans]|uniref:cuticle protein 21-like n=1 Tax=Ischnura elegans TaxID=197161 RepID=UPI001ED8985B|nr:cuticle protein 21-like [Ischnura elegans]